jgi:hypothetical protein
MSKKIGSVANSAASSGRAAEKAWIRASTLPTARAVAASAWPSRSACFHST